MSRFLVGLLVAAGLFLSPVAKAENVVNDDTLHVTGTYNVKATPDIAYVDFAILADAKEVEDAKKKADNVLRSVKDVAAKLKIADKDLKSGYVSIQPKYTYLQNRPPLLEGYNVSYNLTMTVHTLSDIGRVVQHLVQAGVTNVNNVRYDLDDSEAFKREALKKAVGNAKAKADVLAIAAGTTLDHLVRIEEGAVTYNPAVVAYAMPMLKRGLAADSSAGEIPPAGELEVNAQVTLVYALKH